MSPQNCKHSHSRTTQMLSPEKKKKKKHRPKKSKKRHDMEIGIFLFHIL